ncbi:MucR family transcriptional regulator [Nitrospirillum sp. BR 11164]|uniref:MucR family transcriptional regulator n=1 Tax=Nitrospirillum sp. BR 11164 TaxID=3104324 RepID=UPI002AFF696B|nr:MucR family transcriptional regulator [Nitrospirillum sp. BR 11164]MEA1647834.1 MucR family transcriptional regulator [Nitrospirillum sp. BR 11164]
MADADFEVLQQTAQLVAAYLSNAGNHLAPGEVPGLIKATYASLSTLGQEAPAAAEPEKLVPAVPIRKSVTPDYIVCLEDGKKLKMLKRHLRTAYGLSPEEYRERWGLPVDYPMVAPNYAEQRSGLAKAFGLGKRDQVPVAEEKPTRKGKRATAA